MRQVVNISLPQSLSKKVDELVKKGNYATRSEFFRDLIRARLEEGILKGLNKSKKEISQGKGKELKSLKDLR